MLRRSTICAALAFVVLTIAACGGLAHARSNPTAGTSARTSGIYGIVVVAYPAIVSVAPTITPPRLPGGFGFAEWRVPMTDAHLVIRATGRHAQSRKVVSGDDGIFEVDLAPGSYVVSLGDPPYGGAMARAGRLWRAQVHKDRAAYCVEVTVRPGRYTRVIIGPTPASSQLVSTR